MKHVSEYFDLVLQEKLAYIVMFWSLAIIYICYVSLVHVCFLLFGLCLSLPLPSSYLLHTCLVPSLGASIVFSIYLLLGFSLWNHCEYFTLCLYVFLVYFSALLALCLSLVHVLVH